MAIVRFVFVLQCIFLLNIYCQSDINENIDEIYRPQIWCFVNHLNSDPNRVYNYNYATLISAQNKDIDSTELILDIEVDCHQSNKCITTFMQCNGTVAYNSELANYELIPGYVCAPKIRIDLARDDEIIPQEEKAEEHSELEQPGEIDLTHEVSTDGQVSGEQFVAIRQNSAYCLGCPMDLNTNIEGLDLLTDTALKHIETERTNKQALIRIVRIQQQVVSGIKYILQIEIAPTTCPKNIDQSYLSTCTLDPSAPIETCEVTYFQQPWISKTKNIISNNCTESQEYTIAEPPAPNHSANDLDNEIDVNFNYKKTIDNFPEPNGLEDLNEPNYDTIAETGHADDILKIAGGISIMDSSRMKETESQIIHQNPEVKTTTMTSTTQSVLTEEQKAALDDFLGMMGDEPRLRRSNKNNDDSSSSSSSEEDNNNNDKHSNKNDDDDNRHSKKKPHKHHHDDDDDNNNNDDDDDNNKNHKNKNDNNDTSSSSSSSSEENHRNKRDVSSDDASASTEQKSNEENNDLHPLKQKRSADKSSSEELNPDGTKKASGSSSEEHNTEENRVKRNVETSEEISSEESKGGVKKRSIPSYFVKISPDEKNFVLNLADYSINTLNDIDSDNHKRVVLQILAAKKSEEPITILYHLTLRVGISRCPEDNAPIDLTKIHKNTDKCKEDLFENLTKICKIQVEVTKEKKNPKVVKSHCQNMKKDPVDSDVNRTFRAKRGGVPGGVNNADVNDPKLKKFMEDTLKQMDESDGNGKKTELIEIVSAKTQVVAGMKYIIDANIKINGETKRCNLVIWDRPWIKTEGKEITINCENSATSSKLYRVRRSHVQKQILGKDDHDVNVGMFKEFAQTHNKSYSSKSEFKKRYNIYRQNMKMIKTLNENEQGTAKYGPTMFADLTREEFKRYLGLNPALKHPNNIPYPDAQIPDIDLPNEFDWRTKGAVTEVKNQGSCGSCWAFSVTGNIEGQNAIKTGKLIELSEQELVDCDTLDSGCNGGLPDNAYRAIEQIGGLETETDYPYDAEDEKCHFKKSLARVQISGAVNISSNETNMAKWLVSNGPISIGINANAMQFYMGGVSHPWKFLCSPENLDHGVLIVGYGVHKYPLFNRIMPYWIVKNSWGPTWGEQGYYRVYRGDGTCGVNQMASSAII